MPEMPGCRSCSASRARCQTMNGKDKNIRKNPNKSRAIYFFNIIFMCLLTLASIGVTAYLFMHSRQVSQELQRTANEVTALETERKSLYTAEQLQVQVENAGKKSAAEERTQLLNQIQTTLESGGSTTALLRQLYQDELVLLSSGKYSFYPILNSLRKNTYKSSDYQLDSAGRLEYLGSEPQRVIQGIDVSEETGAIDWELVQNDGISFAMIRIGTRHVEPVSAELLSAAADAAAENEGDTSESGQETDAVEAAAAAGEDSTGENTAAESAADTGSEAASDTTENAEETNVSDPAAAETEGTEGSEGEELPESILAEVETGDLLEDASFKTYMDDAIASGMEVGAYFELAAMTSMQAQEEAQFAAQLLEPYKSNLTYPVAVVLKVPEKDSPLAMLSSANWTTNTIAFVSQLQQEGYKVIVCGDLSMFVTLTDLSRLEPYEKWYAGYDLNVYFPYAFRMWQYSVNGKVQGIEGDVHLDAVLEG